MSSLTGQLVADTYKALLKIIDNDVITATEKQISDGYGQGSNVFIDQNGFLRANKYKVTGGTANQFLKANGTLDSTSYLPTGTSTTSIPEGTNKYFTELRVLNSILAGFTPTSGTVTATDSVLTAIQKIWWNIVNGGGGGGGGYVPYSGATQNLNLGEYGINTGFVGFDLTPTNTPTSVGTMSWNDQDGTAELKLKGGNVTLQLGQESLIRVVNKTGSNLLEANYQAVRISGAQGNRLKVDLAQANNDANSAETIGLVTETINNNNEGFITTSGIIHDINTTGSLQGETWADGDMLYLSGTTAGKITNVKPQAPIHTVIIGYVVRAHATQGQIFVKVDNGYELDELHNVKITSATENDFLVYDGTNSLWENRSIIKNNGYLPYFDSTDLFKQAPIYTNGTKVAVGVNSFYGTNILTAQGGIWAEELTLNDIALFHTSTLSGNFFISRWSGTNWDVKLGFYANQITSSVDIEATKFIKTGGLATEFLMANGNTETIASLNILSGAGTIGFIPKYDGSTITLANSVIFQNNTSIGIGTTNPTTKLEVRGGAIGVYASSSYYGKMEIANNDYMFTSGSGFYFNVNNATSNVFAGRINNSGNWGIGVLNPTQKLDVNGNINIPTGSNYLINGSQLTTDNIPQGSTNQYLTEAGLYPYMYNFQSGEIRWNVVTHQFYMNQASASANGWLSSTDWTTFNSKQSQLNGTGFVKVSGTTISYDNNTYYLASNPNSYIALTALSATTPLSYNNTTGVFSIAQASTSTNGFLSSTDWNTFNNKQNALGYTPVPTTRTITINGTAQDLSADRSWTIAGTISGLTTNYVPKATSATTLGNSLIFDNGTNIGIGTTSPTYKLDVAHSSAGEIIRGSYTGGSKSPFLAFQANDDSLMFLASGNSDNTSIMGFKVNGSERARITASGNVGIGTSSPSYKLDVNGTGRFTGTMYLTTSATLTMSNSANTSNFDIGLLGGDADANAYIYQRANSNLYIGTNNTTRLTIASTGAATFSSSVTASQGLNITGYGGFFNSANKFGLDQYLGAARFYSNGSDTSTKGSYEFHINSSNGSLDVIALGISSTGSATFSSSVTATQFKTPGFAEPSSVKGLFNNTNYGGPAWNNASLVTGNGATGVMMGGDAATYTYGWIQGVQTDNGANKGLYLNPLGANVLIVPNGGGNVGIGTTSPSTKLFIYDDGTGLGFSNAASGNFNIGLLAGTGSQIAYIFQRANADLIIGTNNTERMRITSGGNVGIGTINPLYKLDVSGSGNTTRLQGGTATAPNLRIQSAIYPNIDFISDDTNTGNRNWKVASVYNQYGMFEILSSTTAGGTDYTSRLAIDNIGRVGIGITSPLYKLDIYNVGSSNATTRLYGNDQVNVRLRFENVGGGGRTYEIVGGLAGANNSSFSIFDATASATRFSIDSTGAATFSLSVTAQQFTASDGYGLNVGNFQVGAITGNRFYIYNGTLGIDNITISPSTGITTFARAISGTSATFSSSVTANGIINGTTSQFTAGGTAINTIYASGPSTFGISSSDAIYLRRYDVGQYQFQTVSGGASGGNLSLQSYGGNVGIGTTSPSFKLDVSGTGRFTDDITISKSSYGSYIINNGSVYTYFAYASQSSNYSTNAQVNDAVIRGYNGISFAVNDGTGALRLASNKVATFASSVNVGDNTGSPYLQVAGGSSTGSIGSGAYLQIFDYGNYNGWIQQFGGNNGRLAWWGYNSSSGAWSEKMTLTQSGNVGIGTTSPSGKLHVNGGDSLFGNGNLTRILGASQVIDFTNSAQSAYVAGRINGLSLKFYTNTGAGIDIDSSGNVGIATASPSAQLHVAAGNVVIGSNPTSQYKFNVQGNSGRFIGFWTPTINGTDSNGIISHNGSGFSDQTTMGYWASSHYFNLANSLTNGGTIQVGGSINITGSFMVNGVPITSGGGATSLAGLTDVSITSPATGQILVYDASISKWKNQANSASGVTGSGTSGNIPLWSGSTSLGNSSITQSVNSIKIGGSTAWGFLSNTLNIVYEFALIDAIGSWYRYFRLSGSGSIDFISSFNTAQLSAAGNWLNASDVSYKKNIVDIKYSVNDIIKLLPRNYEMKSDDSKHIGFVAQELIDIIPEVVERGDNGKLLVDYGALVSLAIQGIKELKAEIESLKANVK